LPTCMRGAPQPRLSPARPSSAPAGASCASPARGVQHPGQGRRVRAATGRAGRAGGAGCAQRAGQGPGGPAQALGPAQRWALRCAPSPPPTDSNSAFTRSASSAVACRVWWTRARWLPPPAQVAGAPAGHCRAGGFARCGGRRRPPSWPSCARRQAASPRAPQAPGRAWRGRQLDMVAPAAGGLGHARCRAAAPHSSSPSAPPSPPFPLAHLAAQAHRRRGLADQAGRVGHHAHHPRLRAGGVQQ
jgi:hypothetical protein